MVKYAIFDMDGTLLDTESVYMRSWVEMGDKWGLDRKTMENMYIPFICGRSVESSKQVLKDHFGDDFDSEGFMDERMALYSELTSTDLRLKKGCRELLDFLKEQGIPMAIATSTVPEITNKNLKRMGIVEYFDAIVMSTMVKHGKPAPDIFIEAGKRIGVSDPAECIVCEDSYSGIFAAEAANMLPILIPDLLRPTEETDKVTYATVDSLLDVIELIKKENNLSK
ncbi:MAG: HAD family phosphatase [Clostridia bacterium]|nr:HAD family phosphatase [Clostridia bacterium]